MQFRNHRTERSIIDSIESRLTDDENALRMVLMERTIERGGPVNAGSLADAGISHPDARSLIERLAEKRVIVQNQAGDVVFIYPVSALPTRHKVALQDGRRFFAMCAVDAIGTAFTFQQDVEVESECRECGKQISIGIENERPVEVVPPSTHVLHVDLTRFDDRAAAS